MKVVQADGVVTKSGGQVVKNVSGYDMTRLHIGGLGTLGVIAEVSLKLTPLPRVETTIVAAFDTSDKCLSAALGVFHSGVVPLAMTCFDAQSDRRAGILGLGGDHFLAVRLGGRPLTLDRQLRDCDSICREHGSTAIEKLDASDAGRVWRKLADFGWEDSTRSAVAGRASLLPTRVREVTVGIHGLGDEYPLHPAVISHPGHGTVLIHWFADADEASDDTAGDVLGQTLDVVHRAGGQMVIERCPVNLKSRFDIWDDVGESLAIMRRMREQYDPRRVLNPGRFVGGI
jgi:FAD/FMN-containing dehydrogenase